MLGYYNRSVILTYIGLSFTIFGIYLGYTKHMKYALLCLIGSGFCDMFDGKIARMTKRSKDAQVFGIQIDSLCDVICFGAFPALLGIFYGMSSWQVIILCLFVVAGIIRLGYFNVMEQKRQDETSDIRKYYEGLPITSTAILFPIYIIIIKFFDGFRCQYSLLPFYIVVGLLFITKIKVKKPGTATTIIFIVLAALIMIKLLLL